MTRNSPSWYSSQGVPAKALWPMVVTVAGTTMVESFEQPAKAWVPISLRPSGRVTDSTVLPRKASRPMTVTGWPPNWAGTTGAVSVPA